MSYTLGNRLDRGQKIIDSRDVIARAEELRNELDDFRSTAEEHGWEFHQVDGLWRASIPGDESADTFLVDSEEEAVLAAAAACVPDADLWDLSEYEEVRDFAEEVERYGGRDAGALIYEDHWVEYCQELADELGGVTDAWPHRHIDWDAAADALKLDYTELDFGGYSYFVRS